MDKFARSAPPEGLSQKTKLIAAGKKRSNQYTNETPELKSESHLINPQVHFVAYN